MYPEGTEVYYKGHHGIIKYSDDIYVSVCIRVFPQEPVRNVCLVVYKNDWDQLTLVHGNHSRDD